MFIYDLTLLSTLFDTHLLVRKLRIIFEKLTRIRPKIDNRPTQIDIFSSFGTAFQGNFTCSLTSGRMRYAPTPIQLKSGLHWVKIQSQIDRFNHRIIIELMVNM